MRHNINLLKHYKNVIFLFFILVIIGLSSCEEKCIGIINNSYEGFGYFIYKNESQDGLYQIYFIPVCNNLEKEKYDNKELRPMLGMIFYSSSKNHQFRDIFIYSKPYSKIYYDPLNRDTSRISYQYLPVYIEFEGLNFTETFSLSPKIQREKIHFINDDNYNI
ncbi:MAG: hypothetical protein LUG18_05590, partial [Candidatus Azobacteroides sp.]|nr:hypothetical protein [Candidatus Azobacteroides sp.]